MTKEYIAYQGEQPIGIGTIEELADKLGYTYRNMRTRSYPSIRKRIKDGNNAILLYEIEDDNQI